MEKKKLQTISLNNIGVKDAFWDKYISLVTKEIIPYQWDALNDQVKDAEPSHCILNFQVAAGLKEGTFEGFVFQDTDLAKWLEAVAYSLSYEKNEELEKLADGAIELIGKAQEENGYLDTYFTILEPGKQFCNLKEGHELYTAGHMIEAAVAYYKVTGKDTFLNIMKKTADLICDVFHTERYENAVPGHEEIELALVKLYEVTGEKKYLSMAKDFVERRGTKPNYLEEESSKEWFVDVWHDQNPYHAPYGQAHLPVRQQKTAEGHAVRAVYLYCAMADLAFEYQDKGLFDACETLYQNIVDKRMYITGGIGSSGILERFTTDYDLPNASNYAESCASIGLALFCRRMAQITGDAKYVETMETALINTVLAGIAMDGKSFFYVNPLEVWPDACMEKTSMEHVKPVRQKWFGCACCPPNIARTLASFGEYICFTGEDSLWINLLTGAEIAADFNGKEVRFKMESEMPWEGKVKIRVSSRETAEGNLYIRVPEYGKDPVFTMDGKKVTPQIEKGYACFHETWNDQVITMEFSMDAHFVYANPNVRADAGKAAVVKGPLVYCLEEADNGENLSGIFLDTAAGLEENFSKDLLGGVTEINATGKRIVKKDWEKEGLYRLTPVELQETQVKFVPYCHWGNRKTGEMAVWVKTLM